MPPAASWCLMHRYRRIQRDKMETLIQTAKRQEYMIKDYEKSIDKQNQLIEKLKRKKKPKKRIKWIKKCRYCMVEEQTRTDINYMRLKDSVLLGIIKYKVNTDRSPTRKEIKKRFNLTDNMVDKILNHIRHTHDIDFMTTRILTEDTIIKDIKKTFEENGL